MLVSPTAVKAELVQPNFTQGSMNSTTTTTVDIEETITTTTYGAALSKWSGDNITHTSASSGGICLLYTSPSPRDGLLSRMPSSA